MAVKEESIPLLNVLSRFSILYYLENFPLLPKEEKTTQEANNSTMFGLKIANDFPSQPISASPESSTLTFIS